MTLTVETWIEALESGKYQQGTHGLRTEGKFCCLGVACDLSRTGKWHNRKRYVTKGHTNTAVLPPAVRDLLGLSEPDGNFEFGSLPSSLKEEIRGALGKPVPPHIMTLSCLNDYGVPFPLIAKVIRARPKGLFREDAQP